MISANNTTPFGVADPTRSIAADRIITYSILFKSPNMKNDVKIFVVFCNMIICDIVPREMSCVGRKQYYKVMEVVLLLYWTLLFCLDI